MIDPTPPAPLTEPPELADPPETSWPKVIGIISIIYACCGFGCQLMGIGSIFLTEFLMGLWGMEVAMPTIVKITIGATAVVMTGLGFLMLAGGIALVRRRRAGVSRLKTWAILRVITIVVGVAVGILTLPAQVQFQEQILEAQNQMFREQGQTARIKPFDEDATWTERIVMAGVFSGLFAIYPVFLGFYFSRKKIQDEVALWE